MSQVPHDPYAPHDPAVVEAREVKSVPVPKGTSDDVLDWVNEDPDRAQQAYDFELATSKPRKGLLEKLEEILGE